MITVIVPIVTVIAVWVAGVTLATAASVSAVKAAWVNRPTEQARYIAEERAEGRKMIFLPVTALVKLIKH